MSMTRLLGPLAPEAIFVQSDIEAKTLAVLFGVADKFTPPAHDKWVHVEFYEEHPTHWVAVQRYTGYPNPADNGWSVMFGPKSVETMDDFVARFSEKITPPPHNRF